MIARTLAATLAVSLVSSLFASPASAIAIRPSAGLSTQIDGGIATGYTNARPHQFIAPSDRGMAADVARVRDGRDLGRAGSNTPVHIALLMRPQHQADLDKLAMLQGTKGSAYYHRYLNPKQFTAYFAPSPQVYARTAQMLKSAGFRITQTFANRGMIGASGYASSAERYFHTRIDLVRQPGRKLEYANVTPAIMPAELAADVVSVAGLHSTVQVRFPLHRSALNRTAILQARALAKRAIAAGRTLQQPVPRVVAVASPTANPKPISTTLPSPGPQPTLTIETPLSDYSAVLPGTGYGPPIFATAYDYPVQHGYNGKGHAAGSVIDSDYNSSDLAALLADYKITRTGTENRVCTGPDPTACNICPNSATTESALCDTEGESTLDAEAIETLAPGADFYEYLTPTFDDAGIEGAYERAVNDDVVDAVNSSFGGCETDDPSFQYSSNVIGEEGAVEGITFSASTGDTGAENCGTYVTNGLPQTFINASSPSSAFYFTAVGGTAFYVLTSCSVGNCYTEETAWTDGGGGTSVLEPLPSWQATAVANASALAMVPTTGRNTPDLAMDADPGVGAIGDQQGNGFIICFSGGSTPPCVEEPTGGTSLASPMFIAMQTEVNEVQGSRNGWVNPRLYAIDNAFPSYAFRDITLGTNTPSLAAAGYDNTTGLGSPLGFELAGAE